jgi:DNA-binding Lrp family transcriptional regulator
VQTQQSKVKIGKLSVCIYPELVSSASKQKKLDVFAVWLVLRTIDVHKKGAGKFSYKSFLEIIEEVTKCNKNYCYEIFKKGIDLFWKKPISQEGTKVIYLIGLEKVALSLSFDLGKTKPFLIKMEDLFNHNSSSELKNYLCNFVIGRFGQSKPITISSLSDNLGVSKSTVKRRIASSEDLIKHRNFYISEKKFKTSNDAYQYLNKIKNLVNTSNKSYKIINKDKEFMIVQQLGNSYSLDDYSRGKISKRPRVFKQIDEEIRDTLDSKKFYVSKAKQTNDVNLRFTKVKNTYEDSHLWKMSSGEISNDVPKKTRKRFRNKKEC